MELLLGIVLRTVAVYLFLLVGLRLLGRGEAAQLRTIDLVLLLVLANSLQNAMVGADTSLIGGIVAAATLLTLARILHILEMRFPRMRRTVEGEPTLLVRNGRIIRSGLARANMTEEDLALAARRVGVAELKHIKLAILEADGEVSVIGGQKGTSPTRRTSRTRTAKRARN
jgi:uncharacterized membrane protein YcaP (DUF421 family)